MERYIPPDIFKGKDMKELALDMCTLGIFVIGVRAYLQPDRYGDGEFIQNAIESARVAGLITSNGVSLPVDIAEEAYPTNLNIRHQ